MRKLFILAVAVVVLIVINKTQTNQAVAGDVYQNITSYTQGEVSVRENIYVAFDDDIILLDKEKIAATSPVGVVKPYDVIVVDGNKLHISFVQKTDDTVKVDGVVLKRYIAALKGGMDYEVTVDEGAVANKENVSVTNDSFAFPIKTKTAIYLGKSVPEPADNVSRLTDVEMYIHQSGYKLSNIGGLDTKTSDYYLKGDKTGYISIAPAYTNPLTNDGFYIRFRNVKPLPAGEKITAGIKPSYDTGINYAVWLYQDDVAAKIRWDERHYMPPVEFSFTTTESDDVTPPAPPQNVNITFNLNGKIVLSWQNPSDEDFAGVEILTHGDGRKVSLLAYVPAPENSYTIFSDKSFSYGVLFRSVDKCGNKTELKYIPGGEYYEETYYIFYRPAHKITPRVATASDGHKILVSWAINNETDLQYQTVYTAMYGTDTWQKVQPKTFWNRASVINIRKGLVSGMLTDLPPGKYALRIDDKGYFVFSHNGKEITRQEWEVNGDPVDNDGQGFEVKPLGVVNKRFDSIAFGFWDGSLNDRSPRFGEWKPDVTPTLVSSPEWLEQHSNLYDRLHMELANNPLTADPLGYEWWGCKNSAVFIAKVNNADGKIGEIKKIYVNNKTTGKIVVQLNNIANIGDIYSDHPEGVVKYLCHGSRKQALYDKDTGLLISGIESANNWVDNWRFFGCCNPQYVALQKAFGIAKQTGWAVGDNLLEFHVVWQDTDGLEHDDAVAEEIKQVGTPKNGFARFPVKYSVRMSDQKNDAFLEFDVIKDRWGLGWQGEKEVFPKPSGEAKINSPIAGKVVYGKAYVAVPTWRGADPWYCPYPPGHPSAPTNEQDFAAVFASTNPKLVITHKINDVSKGSVSVDLIKTTLHKIDSILEAKVAYRIFSADFQITLEPGKNEFVFDVAADSDRVPDYAPDYLAPELPGSIDLAPYADKE